MTKKVLFIGIFLLSILVGNPLWANDTTSILFDNEYVLLAEGGRVEGFYKKYWPKPSAPEQATNESGQNSTEEQRAVDEPTGESTESTAAVNESGQKSAEQELTAIAPKDESTEPDKTTDESGQKAVVSEAPPQQIEALEIPRPTFEHDLAVFGFRLGDSLEEVKARCLELQKEAEVLEDGTRNKYEFKISTELEPTVTKKEGKNGGEVKYIINEPRTGKAEDVYAWLISGDRKDRLNKITLHFSPKSVGNRLIKVERVMGDILGHNLGYSIEKVQKSLTDLYGAPTLIDESSYDLKYIWIYNENGTKYSAPPSDYDEYDCDSLGNVYPQTTHGSYLIVKFDDVEEGIVHNVSFELLSHDYNNLILKKFVDDFFIEEQEALVKKQEKIQEGMKNDFDL